MSSGSWQISEVLHGACGGKCGSRRCARRLESTIGTSQPPPRAAMRTGADRPRMAAAPGECASRIVSNVMREMIGAIDDVSSRMTSFDGTR